MRESGLLISSTHLPLSTSPSHPSFTASHHHQPVSTPAVFVVPGTLFPHTLFDQIMPTVSGTQWQLLCVIIRQTQGWFDPQTGGRKTRDWLSHSQLRRRTGRGSDAICRAVDALVRKELIEVRDEQGQVLATAQQRQRSYSRLYYSLAEQVLDHFQPASSARPTSPVPLVPSRKAETTKEKLTNKKPKKPFAKPEWKNTRFVSALLPVESKEHNRHSDQNGQRDKDACGCFAITSSPFTANSPAPSQPHPDLLRFIETFHDERRKRLGSNDEPEQDSLHSREQARLQVAIERYGFASLVQLLGVFLGSDTFYTRKHGHSLPVFLDMLHILPTLRSKSSTD